MIFLAKNEGENVQAFGRACRIGGSFRTTKALLVSILTAIWWFISTRQGKPPCPIPVIPASAGMTRELLTLNRAPNYTNPMAYTDPPTGPGLGATMGGCLVAALFALALLFMPLFVWAWVGAHCSPAPDCQQGIGWWFVGQAALAFGAAAILGVSVRALLHWSARRMLDDHEAGGPPPLALLGLVAATVVAIWWFSGS